MRLALLVVVALEVVGLLLLAAAAFSAAATYVGLWAGFLAAGVVVLAGAVLADRNVSRGDRGADVRPSEPRS